MNRSLMGFFLFHSTFSPRFLYVVACTHSSFFLTAPWSSFLWPCHPLSILCCWTLGCFQYCATISTAAEISFECVLGCTCSRVSLGYLCRSRIYKIMPRCFPKQLYQCIIPPVEYDLPQILFLSNIWHCQAYSFLPI